MSEKFSTPIGFLLATIGSAVGLGSIWRFPYVVADNGHGAFIIMYLICAVLIGIPLILAEYTIGKEATRKAPCLGIVSIWKAHSKSKWAYCLSYIFVITTWLVYSYYMVICGWVLIYFVKTVTGNIVYNTSDIIYYQNLLNGIFANNVEVITATLIALTVTGMIAYRGVSKGIEKLSVIGMPLLFFLLIIIIIRVATLDGAMNGFKYYLSISASEFTFKNLLSALGQAFFSLSLGLGILVTYASYTKECNLLVSATNTVLATSVISILAAGMIIPSLFIFGFTNTGGPGLIFVTLPAVFANIYFGSLFAILFFSLAIVATITSTISLLEVLIPVVMNVFKIKRLYSILFISIITMFVSLFHILSFNVLSNVKIFNKTIFDVTDFVSSNILMPIGAIVVCLYLGFVIKSYGIIYLNDTLNQKWIDKLRVYKIWFFWVKYVVPIIIFIIIVLSLNGNNG